MKFLLLLVVPWMFRPAPYSHMPPKQPVVQPQPVGESVNGGWRWNRSTINIGGQVYDNTNVYESWIQVKKLP